MRSSGRERRDERSHGEETAIRPRYLIDSNATQAAIRAGYKPKTAKQQGSWLLRNVEEVAAAVAEGQAKKAEELDLDHEWVLRRLIENVERAM